MSTRFRLLVSLAALAAFVVSPALPQQEPEKEGAGLVIGAKVPILLTSRADDERSRLFSCAVATLYAHWLATGQSAVCSEDVKEVAEEIPCHSR